MHDPTDQPLMEGPPPNEQDRLTALRSYEIMDTPGEKAFDDIVALAARLTRSPISLVSLIDAERHWSKAGYGLDAGELPLEHSFCAHVLPNPNRPLVVPDARLDRRFSANPFVTGQPDIRAYLGLPLVTPDGHALGSLCVIDRVPRDFTAAEVDALRTLAEAVVANLELRRALIRARTEALTDPLTGLSNRRAVMQRMADTPPGTPVAVVLIDLDHLKEINDGEGHEAGDALLQATAIRIQQCLRPDDMAGRIGGDEFVVLLSGEHAATVAPKVAARIAAALHQPVPHGHRLLRSGATLGVAASPANAATPELAFRVADEMLVRQKHEGRGEVRLAGRHDGDALLDTAAIIRAFDARAMSATPHEGTRVAVQPILALRSDGPPRMIAIEALARWRDEAPDGHGLGEVPPVRLFTAIGPERASMLSGVVRGQALEALAQLRRAGLARVRVSLNLSAAEIARPDTALHLADQVARAGLTLADVEVEITEEVLLDRVSDRTLSQLAELRRGGALLILDDFGTGTSGLAQMLRLPLDGLKLDKSFVQKINQDRRAAEIIRATIMLGHDLGLQVVAEGVETTEQCDRLMALGCDAVQGYLFARPMPPDQLMAWVAAQSQAA